MKFKIEIGFGVELDKGGETIRGSTRENAINEIRKQACAQFGGCTLIPTFGDWIDPQTSNLHREAGYALVVYADASDKAGALKAVEVLTGSVKQNLNQAAVAVCISEVDFLLV